MPAPTEGKADLPDRPGPAAVAEAAGPEGVPRPVRRDRRGAVALLVQLLVGFGNLIGHTAHFRVGGDVHFLNLYTVLIGDTATGGKGMSWGRCRSVLAKADPDWCEQNTTPGGIASGEGGRSTPSATPAARTKASRTSDSRHGTRVGRRFITVAAKDGSTVGPILRGFWDSGNAPPSRPRTPTAAPAATCPSSATSPRRSSAPG